MTGWCDTADHPITSPACWGKPKSCCDALGAKGTWYEFSDPYLLKNRCCTAQQTSFPSGPTITGAGDQTVACDTKDYYKATPANNQTDWCGGTFAHMDVGATQSVLNETICQGKAQPCVAGYKRIACPPSPLPAPSPSPPSPPPPVSGCCSGQCSDGWCNKSTANCTQCGGTLHNNTCPPSKPTCPPR